MSKEVNPFKVKIHILECEKEELALKVEQLEQRISNLQAEQIAEMKEHQEAMQMADRRIKDTEAQNKRVLEKLDLIVRSNQELEQQLADSKNKCYTLESYNNFLLNQCKKLIRENKKLTHQHEDK